MSYIAKTLEFPSELQQLYKKAIRYEVISFFYMISATIFSFLAMGNSQTMKTVWLEDTLGIIPPASFLLASRIIKLKANRNFPYGFHRVTSMAFLVGSLALLILGLYLFFDGLIVLVKAERPNIANINIAGYSIWQGYLMMLALLWSSVPSTILGHVKIGLSKQIYDKSLYADSKMNKASWMSGFASIFGIIGIGAGYWWADATVGMLISLNIINDGFTNLKQAILDLLDEVPRKIGSDKIDPIITEVKNLVKTEKWIKSSEFRFRDEGHVFFGEIFIEPVTKEISVEQIENLKIKIQQYHWRMHDIVITVTK